MPSPPLDLARLPSSPGVYRFIDGAGRVMYIGRAIDLRRRVRSYWGSQRGRPRMRRMVPQIAAVEIVVCASEHEAAWLERNLLEHKKPRWNRARGGLETPVYLRLDPGPRAPSLKVVHEIEGALAHYGPYLGGTRVRLACTALGTSHPLAYTGGRLTGSEQAMADARGVRPEDRDLILGSLTSLLGGDQGAIAETRAHFTERRNAASKALEFELAARIHEQAEAVDWLVSTQRVTAQGADDAVACGWSGGVLVQFGVMGGRVRTWTQRPCTEAEAEPLLTATPPTWSEFAAHNAELAAELHALHAA